MLNHAFTYHSATITLHRQTNGDEIDSELIISILLDGVPTEPRGVWVKAYHRAARYAAFLVSIDKVDGDAGIPIPDASAPSEEVRAGYEAWLNERGLYSAWMAANAKVNGPVGDADTAPGVDDLPNA